MYVLEDLSAGKSKTLFHMQNVQDYLKRPDETFRPESEI